MSTEQTIQALKAMGSTRLASRGWFLSNNVEKTLFDVLV